MSPRTRHSLIVAAAFVGLAAVGGIAAILGWLPESFSGDAADGVATPTRIVGTAPPESLSPGESLVPPPDPRAAPNVERSATKLPEAPPVQPFVPSPAKPVGSSPAKPVPPPEGRPPTVPRRCPNCGTIASTTYLEREPRRVSWEVRVKFDDGTRLILRYPTNPGFRIGERVVFSQGRLHRD